MGTAMSGAIDSKITTGEDLVLMRSAMPGPVVFTNGVFDVLHRGHASYLHAARALGGTLIVGVNSDESTRSLGKGANRPLNKEADRMFVLAALSSTDWVTMFSDPTPLALISMLQPDIYVKGGDYDIETLEESRLVRSWGGRSCALPFVTGFSTTSLVERIREN